MAICPFRAIPPAALDAPFAQFAPVVLKSFRHPGEGVPILPIFETPRGGTKILRRLWGGGDVFFYWCFSQKVPPPLTRNSEQSLSATFPQITTTIHTILKPIHYYINIKFTSQRIKINATLFLLTFICVMMLQILQSLRLMKSQILLIWGNVIAIEGSNLWH